MTDDLKEKMKQSFIEQLHEQYAVNNNAGMQSVVSILVAMFAAVGAYGYVWIHYQACDKNCAPGESFFCSELMFAFVAALTILGIMNHICVYQGVNQRMEQFITYRLRKKCCLLNEEFFPSRYNPFDKKGLEVVQGLYGEFVKIFAVLPLILFVSYVYRIWPVWEARIECCLPLISLVFFYTYWIVIFYLNTKKYYERETEFVDDNPQKNEWIKEKYASKFFDEFFDGFMIVVSFLVMFLMIFCLVSLVGCRCS